jgi:glycosyltransferase involved in cell wall biosynthesis
MTANHSAPDGKILNCETMAQDKNLDAAQDARAPNALAETARPQGDHGRVQSTRFQITHLPRAIGRALRAPFERLAYHKSGRPRRWIRRIMEIRRARQLHRAATWRAGSSARTGTILVASDFLPQHDQSSGGLRLTNLIAMIGKQGRPIIFVSTASISELPGNLARQQVRAPYEDLLRQTGVKAFVYGAREIETLLQNDKLDLRYAFLSFPEVASALLPQIRARQPKAKIIYDMVDFHATRFEREAALTGDASVAAKAIEMKRLEVSLANAADITVAVSADEKKTMLSLAPLAVVEVLPNIFEFQDRSPAGPSQRRGVLFLGGFWHTPNADAAIWFVKDIWPLILAKAPDCRFFIAGSNPGPDVLALAKTPNVEVLGYVADLDPLYDSVRICVAPLRFGAGVKGKVGQSMAHGVPVVATSIGAEGMQLQDGEQLLIADEPELFARHVLALLGDDALWTRTQTQARDFVQTRFSPKALNAKVEALFNE